jgi:hypothetical protein
MWHCAARADPLAAFGVTLGWVKIAEDTLIEATRAALGIDQG